MNDLLMCMLKWSPYFDIFEEPHITLVWVVFPNFMSTTSINLHYSFWDQILGNQFILVLLLLNSSDHLWPRRLYQLADIQLLSRISLFQNATALIHCLTGNDSAFWDVCVSIQNVRESYPFDEHQRDLLRHNLDLKFLIEQLVCNPCVNDQEGYCKWELLNSCGVVLQSSAKQSYPDPLPLPLPPPPLSAAVVVVGGGAAAVAAVLVTTKAVAETRSLFAAAATGQDARLACVGGRHGKIGFGIAATHKHGRLIISAGGLLCSLKVRRRNK
ncbi:hypothetical protein M5K25_025833 [Dendrobium thyrsiflorum]|uniref:DUF4283 domain-containing protein n=1 Tax=Dendrobium thyrsiflorum TaxID=117978 RepID=A0ABD0TVT5_DENTH